MFSPEDIFVVTGRELVDDLQKEAPAIPRQNFIIEPYAKNTAPALALALSHIQRRDEAATVAILPADHHIVQRERFCRLLETAWQVAQEGKIVTLGISPAYPATGFGYIQQGDALAQVNGFRSISPPLHRETGYRAGDPVPRLGAVQLEFRHVHLAGRPRHERL